VVIFAVKLTAIDKKSLFCNQFNKPNSKIKTRDRFKFSSSQPSGGESGLHLLITVMSAPLKQTKHNRMIAVERSPFHLQFH
jgi:hypothetical protein